MFTKEMEQQINNPKIPKSVRYALARTVIEQMAKNRKQKRELLTEVGNFLGGSKDKTIHNKPIWRFPDNTVATFAKSK